MHLVAQKLRGDGCEASIEGRIGQSQKSIDVVAISQEQGRLAYEITLHLENLVSNITQDIRAGADSVIIVTRDAKDGTKGACLRIGPLFLHSTRNKVSFCTIIDLIG